MSRDALATAGLFFVASALLGSSLEGQTTGRGEPRTSAYPLAPAQAYGDIVTPFFDGWFRNEDGTYTLQFGFLNRNLEEVVEIPHGENNLIEPAEFDGVQPTHFPAVNYGGFGNRRERGAFAVTIPPEFDGDVIWTITHRGQTFSIPGRVGGVEYQLDWQPQAMGSMRPWVWFGSRESGAAGPEGVTAEEVHATSVGSSLELAVWAEDRYDPEQREAQSLNVTWQKHQGPGDVEFEPPTMELEEAAEGIEVRAATRAVFSEPGHYLLRVRVDNFGYTDSRFGMQCCWSNGFVRVTVTP